MSRSIWATALAVIALALMPAVALAATGSDAQQQTHRAAVQGLGSGFPTPSGAVRALQTKLTAAGFEPGPIDGRFGPMTRAAVERFQRADGLAVDGIVGPRTRRGLAAGGLLPGAGMVAPDGSGAVKSLQRRLRRSGFSPGVIDGRYGPRTAVAVRRFQHARHLRASGIATAATLRAFASRTRRPAPHLAPRPNGTPQAAKPKAKPTTPAPAHTPAPAKPVVHNPSTSPWKIVGLVALILGVLALLALRGRRRGRGEPPKHTADPQRSEPTSGAPGAPEPQPAPEAPAPAAAGEDRTSPAAQIAALEAAVAMPSAGSPRNEEVQRTADRRAPVAMHDPEPPEERFERVKALQRQLTWLGLYPGNVDGRYGPLTTEAIRAFQQVRGLPADGIANGATLAALRAGTPDRPFSGRVQRVKELQRELTLRGFEPGEIDGRYGARTTDAVKRFQRSRTLPDDGVADRATLDALYGRKITPLGSRRMERVEELQRQLQRLGLGPGMVDGHYGPLTTQAVKRFQEAHNLPVDGVANPDTLSQIERETKSTP